MRIQTGFFMALGIVSVCLFVPVAELLAQSPAATADKTLLEVEILAPAIGIDPLMAQTWRKVFEEIGESVRIRQPLPSDAPKVDELQRGPFRLVRVVGELDRTGAVTFPGKTFRTSQSRQLAEYLQELKIYGAQGSPVGKPLWGLTKEQFERVYVQLAHPVEESTQGETFDVILQRIPLGSLKIVFHSSAEELAARTRSDILDDELKGLTAGTSLAFVLSQQGLGFHPQRLPGGEIRLMVQSLVDIPDAWPVGWPLPENRRRDEAVPGMFKKVETGVNESPLQVVLKVLESQSGTHILLDRRACLEKELDPDVIMVSYPRRKTAWSLILSHVVVNSHMTMHYRQDEAGTGFMFVNPFAGYRPPEKKTPSEKETNTSERQK